MAVSVGILMLKEVKMPTILTSGTNEKTTLVQIFEQL